MWMYGEIFYSYGIEWFDGLMPELPTKFASVRRSYGQKGEEKPALGLRWHRVIPQGQGPTDEGKAGGLLKGGEDVESYLR